MMGEVFEMTQEMFDFIKTELLCVSFDTYYTESDLLKLAERYDLLFLGEYWDHIPVKTIADVGDKLCFPKSGSAYEVLEVLDGSYKVTLDHQNYGYIAFVDPKYIIIPNGLTLERFKEAHPEEFL